MSVESVVPSHFDHANHHVSRVILSYFFDTGRKKARQNNAMREINFFLPVAMIDVEFNNEENELELRPSSPEGLKCYRRGWMCSIPHIIRYRKFGWGVKVHLN